MPESEQSLIIFHSEQTRRKIKPKSQRTNVLIWFIAAPNKLYICLNWPSSLTNRLGNYDFMRPGGWVLQPKGRSSSNFQFSRNDAIWHWLSPLMTLSDFIKWETAIKTPLANNQPLAAKWQSIKVAMRLLLIAHHFIAAQQNIYEFVLNSIRIELLTLFSWREPWIGAFVLLSHARGAWTRCVVRVANIELWKQ